MAKPTIEDTRWAVTTLGVESTAQSDPDGDLKNNGYQNDDIPDPRDWNWWHRKAHKWFQYLNTAILSGDHAFDGSVTIGGQPLTFVSATFTADPATDQLHVVGHGLLSSGDGPLRTSNVGGSLPGGLSPATNFWGIFVDNDHLQLATTFLDAVNGKAIDLTNAGTGTHTISGMSPLHVTDAIVSRSVVVAGKATVEGDIKTNSGRFKHGTMTIRFPGIIGRGQVQASSWSNGGGYIDGTPFATWTIGILLPDGKRITAVRGRVKDSATGPTTFGFSVLSQIDDASPIPLGSSGVSAGTGAWQTLPVTGLSSVVTPGTVYYVNFSVVSGSGLTRVAWIDVDYDELT